MKSNGSVTSSIILFVIFEGHIGCHTDVRHILDNSCSGRQSCDLGIANELDEREDLSPCPEGLKTYLEATYDCIKGRN